MEVAGRELKFRRFLVKFCRLVSQLLVFLMASTSRMASKRGFLSSNLLIAVKEPIKDAMEAMLSVSLQKTSNFVQN